MHRHEVHITSFSPLCMTVCRMDAISMYCSGGLKAESEETKLLLACKSSFQAAHHMIVLSGLDIQMCILMFPCEPAREAFDAHLG